MIMKDAKVTFADMLGNIGGTLGVFIGLSFVGLLDFFIWIWDWVEDCGILDIQRRQINIHKQHEVYQLIPYLFCNIVLVFFEINIQ